MDLAVRVATATERTAALALLQRVFDEGIDTGRFALAQIWVAGSAEELAGVAAVELGESEWYVWLMAVAPERRRHGIGRAILDAITVAARAAGMSALRVKTYQSWSEMLALLRSSGWCFAGAEAGSRGCGVAEWWLLPLRRKDLRIGVIGGGSRGREWVSAARRCEWVEVVGVADVDTAMQAVWRKEGMPVWSETRALLATAQPDAVIVATPPGVLRSVHEACFEAGVGMLLEKPLAPSLADLRWLQEQLAVHPLPLAVGLQRREHPSYVCLRSRIAAASREAPTSAMDVRMTLGRPVGGPSDGFRSCMSLARGGALLDLGSHALDLVQWLLDAPFELVSCTMSKSGDLVRAGQMESQAAVLGRCGATWVRIFVDRHGGRKDEDVACLLSDGVWMASREAVISPDGNEAFRCNGSWEEAERGCLARLALECSKPPAPVDLWQHIAAMETIERAYGVANTIGMGDDWQA